MSDDLIKTASAATGFDEEKTAESLLFFRTVMEFDAGEEGAFDKTASETIGSLLPAWLGFHKLAEEQGFDLSKSALDAVHGNFLGYVQKLAEDAKKKDEKKDEKKKDEEKKAALAISYAEKVAAFRQQEAFFDHLGERAAHVFLQKVAEATGEGGAIAPAGEPKKSLGDKAKEFFGKAKEKASGAYQGVKGKLFHKDDAKPTASEEKCAFDLQAARLGLEAIKEAGLNVQAGTQRLQEVLHKEAANGDDPSEQVKSASSLEEMLQYRAVELLNLAGYQWA